MNQKSALLLICAALLASPPAFAGSSAPLDALTFGERNSEQAHQLAGDRSETVVGTLGEPARRLLPLSPADWQGGKVSFTMKVDPDKVCYFTIRLSGDEVTENRLMLYVDGKQIGYRHLGDIEQLDYGTVEPAYRGRFFYNTTLLPISLTRGRRKITCEIRSSGRIWGYGQTFEQYQKPQTEPSRGLYRVYTHVDGFFAPPAGEKQGAAPADPPLRQTPGPEVMEALKERVRKEIRERLRDSLPPNQMQMEFLARAYFARWTPAYRNPQVVEKIIAGLDALAVAHHRDPTLVEKGPSSYNPEWFGFGPAGRAFTLLTDQITPTLDTVIDDGAGGRIPRRKALSEMFRASVDWLRTHRRLYTNQSMIVDLNIYTSNRALRLVDPNRALPEATVLAFLYQSVGPMPWLGSDTPTGPQKPLGENYYQLTAKGLTRELGYVGTYDEVLDWVTQIHEVTRPRVGSEGDAKIKAQLVKVSKARASMRYPAQDADGNAVMRLEQVIGWRDSHYPGVVAYGQRASWDGAPFQSASATLDPVLVGYAQQMLSENQYFAAVRDQIKDGGFRVTAGLLDWPEQYETIRALEPNGHRLPMSWDQPDSVFTDEEDGVVGLKRGEEILYVSLYWRARYGINNLARVHCLTPQYDRVAVVREESMFTPSGLEYITPNRTNAAFTDGLAKYPVALDSAHAGEKLPIAKIPDGIAFKPGDESIYAGKADFYTVRYGPYLIGMNCSTDKTFPLTAPEKGTDLVSRRPVSAGEVRNVEPRSTVVLYLGSGGGSNTKDLDRP